MHWNVKNVHILFAIAGLRTGKALSWTVWKITNNLNILEGVFPQDLLNPVRPVRASLPTSSILRSTIGFPGRPLVAMMTLIYAAGSEGNSEPGGLTRHQQGFDKETLGETHPGHLVHFFNGCFYCCIIVWCIPSGPRILKFGRGSLRFFFFWAKPFDLWDSPNSSFFRSAGTQQAPSHVSRPSSEILGTNIST